MTAHNNVIPRDQIEEYIAYLATRFPKTFFREPRQKRPLKKNIIFDLEHERVLDDYKLAATVSFYTRDWYYEDCLLAGSKRIDLDGREVGTVTLSEQLEARERVRAQKQQRRLLKDPISVVRNLHANGMIPTDALSKITAPPIGRLPLMNGNEQPWENPMPKAAKTNDPLQQVQSLLDGVRAVFEQQPDPLQRPLAVAGLRIVIAEIEKTIATLESKEEPHA